ncbi:hypothetical protein A8B83_05250 [Rhodobacteraceae bacterium EhC02]|nr:hypothetical protein A8B83_05250 [Rhodobacteraceae bacterium EhC02]
MRLHQRLKSLEDKAPSHNEGPTVLIIRSVAPTPEGPGEGKPVIAYVLGMKGFLGVTLHRGDQETEEDFLARVEVERHRIHGPEVAT